ncbi:MAG: SCO family protein [Rhodospirillaceae bacterium]|jgi:protein SCO1/2|nr:SCO family protein [Rhodospirillaceae bacterium]MBT4772739.1 SCO family protein [Rhodospirillaceae bacterium]MBT5359329.1 SCO family protein [Rhodospirillaceae bacterium]MBT5771030.1 SCO family protein [Rhodospirillaceae bacterium]MBT6309166.1 SCO family protein [Rhodospirillaceae bacterium]
MRPGDALRAHRGSSLIARMNRKLPIIVVTFVVAVFAFGAWLNLRVPETPENAAVGGMVVNVSIGGPFELTDHTGARMSDEALRGNYALIYFGYTFCPDVCPTELGEIAVALDELGELGKQVTPVMITIDPARDTPDVLAEYVPLFHDRLVGLTGTEAEIKEVAENYRVFYRRFEDPSFTFYLMDHTSFVYLIDPQGAVASMFRYGTPPEDMADAIRQHMRVRADS